MTPRKPTRRDLLVVIGRLQGIVGKAAGLVLNDRAKERAHVVADMLQEAHDLCIKARGFDEPIESNLGPWGVT